MPPQARGQIRYYKSREIRTVLSSEVMTDCTLSFSKVRRQYVSVELKHFSFCYLRLWSVKALSLTEQERCGAPPGSEDAHLFDWLAACLC